MTIQTKPKILLINRPTKSVQAWKDLQEAADVVVIEQLTHDEQAELIKKTVEEQGPFAAWGVSVPVMVALTPSGFHRLFETLPCAFR